MHGLSIRLLLEAICHLWFEAGGQVRLDGRRTYQIIQVARECIPTDYGRPIAMRTRDFSSVEGAQTPSNPLAILTSPLRQWELARQRQDGPLVQTMAQSMFIRLRDLQGQREVLSWRNVDRATEFFEMMHRRSPYTGAYAELIRGVSRAQAIRNVRAAEQSPPDKAMGRAWALLMENLSEAQRCTMRTMGHFDVQSPSDRALIYRIRYGGSYNILVINAEISLMREICVMPEGSLPGGDRFLAQKLALELREKETIQAANW